MEEAENTFRTKTGICKVLDDRIVLERRGVAGAAAQRIQGDDIRRTLLIYLIIAATLAVTGVIAIIRTDIWQGILAFILSAYLAWGVYNGRKNTAAREIPRDAITRVEVSRPRPPLKRAYFAIWFEEDGQELRRIILMPGSLTGGREAFKKAREVFHQADLL